MADRTLRYPTLAALKAAYESGELDRGNRLIVDNDCTTAYDDLDEVVFHGGMPEDLLKEALTLLGIPWEDA